jgi:NADP-dependent aldehyde dehydrogenase
MSNDVKKVLINGQWTSGHFSSTFQSTNPNLGVANAAKFPISEWVDCESILSAAEAAFLECRSLPPERFADFLEHYANAIEADKDTLVELAHSESGLPKSPRLADVELPRTLNQLRQAAASARDQSWRMATVDSKAKLRSCYQAIGPVCVFGPNNFPFAFNSIAGGDFASAIAAGNPVIAKANSSHPETSERFGLLASQSIAATAMPTGLVQLIYRTSHEDGERLIADPRLAAAGYTGARSAGLKLKAVADRVGKPFYAELSSVNPVVFMPGALQERLEALVDEYVTSGLMAAGQFCTNPGMLLLVDNADSEKFLEMVVAKYAASTPGTLLSPSVERTLLASIQVLTDAGAKLLAGGSKLEGVRCAVANTVMQISGDQFAKDPHIFQTEAFGNAVLVILCKDLEQIRSTICSLEGNLTGSIYSSTTGDDDVSYLAIADALAQRVGRLLNDKMPTGVAVSSAMNHGGPYPATSHPGFTAVGFPASMLRFAKLTCFDNVREERLPSVLQHNPPSDKTWRMIDGTWIKG